jgi:hypothetical protein
MNLAWAYSKDPNKPDRAAALAYAEGALVARSRSGTTCAT